MKNKVICVIGIMVVCLAYCGMKPLTAQNAAPVAVPDEKPVVAPAPAAEPPKEAAPAPEKKAVEVAKETPPPAQPAGVVVQTPPVVIQPAAAAAEKNASVSAVVAVAGGAVQATNQQAEFVALPEQKDKLIPGAVVQAKGDTLSIALDDVEMVDVIRMFTKLSKANIIATPSNLTGRVTVNLSDVEWKPALLSILDMNNLTLVEKTPNSGVYSIMPKQAGAPEPLKVATLFLKYASVSNVEGVVKSMLVPGGMVSCFASKNALVVRATEGNLSEITNILARIDKMRDQVFIEAKFLELEDQAIQNLGINWQVLQGYELTASSLLLDYEEGRSWGQTKDAAVSQWDKRQNLDNQYKAFDIAGERLAAEDVTVSSSKMTLTPQGTPAREVLDTIDKGQNVTADLKDTFSKNISDIRTAILGAKDFGLVLSALKEMKGVTIVSNPKLVVANEEPATIHIGEERRPFIASITAGQQGIAPIVSYNPGTPIQQGVKLTVTPTVNTESNITVKIEPELTDWSGEDVAPDGKQKYPIVTKKVIHTVFCLENGKTVAIGGLTQTKDADTGNKVPLLGDIPLIGKYLFSHSSKNKIQRETIIFVTVGLAIPHTIEADTGLPEDAELVQRKMLEKRLQKHKNLVEMEKRNAETDAAINADSDKAKSRLLKLTK
jgi:type II secretory pathway component GspD/PulD (secretin)